MAKILPPVPTEAAVPAATPAAVAAAAVEAQQGGRDAAADRRSAQEQRVQFLQQNAGLLEKFSRDLLPPLLHVRDCDAELHPAIQCSHDSVILQKARRSGQLVLSSANHGWCSLYC